MATNQVQIKRATRGKALHINFGASIYRVIGVDLSDAAFDPGAAEIRDQWKPRIQLILEELRRAPSVLRLSYIADTEDSSLVDKRMQAVKRQITKAWDSSNRDYVLTIEPEIFWRQGAPPKRPNAQTPESKGTL
jgi:large repetitive protein